MIRLKNGSAVFSSTDLEDHDARASALLGRATELEEQLRTAVRERLEARAMVAQLNAELGAAKRTIAELHRVAVEAGSKPLVEVSLTSGKEKTPT